MLKTALRYLIMATVLGLVAVALLVTGRLERRLAEADQKMVTLDLASAGRAYDSLADSLAASGRIPWLLDTVRDELAVRQAVVSYWRGDYAPLVVDHTSPDSSNIALQFVVANAAYRSMQRPDQNRELALGALDHTIGVYRRLLEDNETHIETAFNYELMIFMRNRIVAGDDVPPYRRPTAPGNQGETPKDEKVEDLQIYIPSDSMLDPDDSKEPTIGSGATIRKRG